MNSVNSQVLRPETKSFQLNWKGERARPLESNEILLAADVYSVVRGETNQALQLIELEQKTARVDLDPRDGHVVELRPKVQALDLWGGTLTEVLMLEHDRGKPLAMSIASKEGNLLRQVAWEAGEIVSVVERRVLRTGEKESLTISVHPKTGILTYLSGVEASQQSALPLQMKPEAGVIYTDGLPGSFGA